MERRVRNGRWTILAGVALGVLLLVPAAHAQQATKKEHAFRGKVAKVDTSAKTLTVDGENVEGWMSAMTMVYTVDKEEVLQRVKAGDQITAKVYDGDFKTLHDVQVAPQKSEPPAKK